VSYPPPDPDERPHLMLQPQRAHRKSRFTRNRSGNEPRKRRRIVTASVAIIAAAAIAAGISLYNKSAGSAAPPGPLPVHLPTTPQSYLGVFADGAPASSDGVTAFANATGARPDVLMYYSGWFEAFQTGFAATAARLGAVPLVQMDPTRVSVAAIASGRYDGYLSEYAEAVRAYGHPVILSFGPEMNGWWSKPWGYTHTQPAVFVAAWRHVITVFRALGVQNVTWLWTVNIINDARGGNIPSPAPWWPGNSYVNWVGIDGYFLKPNWQFAPLFGPTINAVHALTGDPILIAETGAVPAANQPAKITAVFAGIHAYGLLGFVWFDSTNNANQNFSISTPAAIAAFRAGATTFTRPGS
jgi:mannan endo-1,4-beta-mannosidase